MTGMLAVELPLLLVVLRLAGAGLIALSLLHVPMGRQLRWSEEAARMSQAGESIFHVHTLFVCVMLVLLGLPALLTPRVFLDVSPAGAWLAGMGLAIFALRLWVQWFVFPAALWRGKQFETAMHLLFTVIWSALTLLFALCVLVQLGRIG